jgi:hypothetical protein
MRLQDICIKYRISDAYLNSKDDALLIAASSIQDLISELNQGDRGIDENKKQSVITKMERMIEFLKDVKNSGV